MGSVIFVSEHPQTGELLRLIAEVNGCFTVDTLQDSCWLERKDAIRWLNAMATELGMVVSVREKAEDARAPGEMEAGTLNPIHCQAWRDVSTGRVFCKLRWPHLGSDTLAVDKGDFAARLDALEAEVARLRDKVVSAPRSIRVVLE